MDRAPKSDAHAMRVSQSDALERHLLSWMCLVQLHTVRAHLCGQTQHQASMQEALLTGNRPLIPWVRHSAHVWVGG